MREQDQRHRRFGRFFEAFGILTCLMILGGVLTPHFGHAAATVFATPADNLSTTLGVAYASGSGSVHLATGYGTTVTSTLSNAGFPAISSGAPLRFTLISRKAINAFGQIIDPSKVAIYLATGISGDLLTGVTVEAGSTDQNFKVGDIWAVNITARSLYQIQTAVSTIGGNYVVGPGVAGGQTIFGGLNANDNLTLNSTAHATKGFVLFNDGSFVGVNTATPQRQFHATGVSTMARFQSTTSSNHGIVDLYASGLNANGQWFQLAFLANDNASVVRSFGAISAVIDDINSATYSGSLQFRTPAAGLLQVYTAKLTGVGGHWLPQGTGGTQSIGSTTNRWAAAISNLDISGTITGNINAPLYDQGGWSLNVKSLAYGAKANCLTLADGAMSSSSNPTYLSSATANFAAADVGKKVAVNGAGAAGATLAATITAYQSATVVTLSQSCQTTVAAATFQYGSDDTTPIQNAINAAATLGGKVSLPIGTYLLTAPLNVPSNVTIEGAGTGTIVQMSLGIVDGGNEAIIQCIGSSGLLTGIVIRDLVLDSQGGSRAINSSIGFQMLLSNAERCTLEGVVFRAHGYGSLPTALPSNPCLFIAAKDFATDLSNTDGGGATAFPTVVVGPSQYHTVRRCTFEGTSTAQFAVRVTSDWNTRRSPLAFANYAQGNTFDACIFTGSYGWNVIEIAGGGSRQNKVTSCRFEGVFASLTCIDFDKGCNYNVAIANTIEGMTKPSYYTGISADRLVAINDHGIPASDASGAYYSEGNRIIGNTIGPIDTAGETGTLESAIAITASTRSLVEGNVIASVNLTAANGNGIVFSECAQATIANNHIKGVNKGIVSDSSATSRYAMSVSGNEIESAAQCIQFAGGTAGSGTAPEGVTIENNRCNNAGTTLDVIYFGPEITAPVVSGNQCIGGSSGIDASTTGAVLSGNNCQGNSATAIRCYFNATITGNGNGGAPNDVLFSGTVSSSTKLVLSGNTFTTVRSKSAAYTMTVADEFVEANATTAGFTVTLIDARLVTGQSRRVVKTDASGNAVTVATTNSQTINGASTASLATQWKVGVFTSDGANWVQQ